MTTWLPVPGDGPIPAEGTTGVDLYLSTTPEQARGIIGAVSADEVDASVSAEAVDRANADADKADKDLGNLTAASQGNVGRFASRTDAAAATILAVLTWIDVEGYASAGDGGGGRFVRGGTLAQFTSADGATWGLDASGGVDVRQFGAKGDGTTVDLTAFTNALASGVQRVTVSAGRYNINGALTLNAGQELVALVKGASVLLNASVTYTGTTTTLGTLTADAATGSDTFAVASAGVATDDWLHITSAMDAATAAAGMDRLGYDGAVNACHFGDFLKVVTVPNGASVKTYAGCLFPQNTGSTVRKVAFATFGAIRNIGFEGAPPSGGFSIKAQWARKFTVTGCSFQYGTESCYGVSMFECLDCEVSSNAASRHGFDNVIFTPGSPGMSGRNTFILAGCHGVKLHHNYVDGGYQCVDFTYINGATNTPCVSCSWENNVSRNSYDGATSHPMSFQISFNDNIVEGSYRGIRSRGRRSQICNNNVQSTKAINAPGYADTGILIHQNYMDGTVVSGNDVRGFQFGVQVIQDLDTTPSGERSLQPGRLSIFGNTFSDCSVGVICDPGQGTVNTIICPVLIEGNTFQNFGSRGVQVKSYFHGVSVIGNVFHGPGGASARAGVEWEANVTHLTVARNEFTDFTSAAFGLRGNGTSTLIADTTTWPSGNAAANLCLEDNRFINCTTAQEQNNIVRDLTAFTQSASGSFGTRMQQGKSIVRAMVSYTGPLLEVQSNGGSALWNVDTSGKLAGSNNTTAKAAIAAATDVTTLKTALAGLFA
jgi:hypothetical protein